MWDHFTASFLGDLFFYFKQPRIIDTAFIYSLQNTLLCKICSVQIHQTLIIRYLSLYFLLYCHLKSDARLTDNTLILIHSAFGLPSCAEHTDELSDPHRLFFLCSLYVILIHTHPSRCMPLHCHLTVSTIRFAA